MCQDLIPPDIVAAVVTIEEQFDISMRDEDAEKIFTLGQLYDYVHARVARGRAPVCVTSAAFYRLRQVLGEICHLPRERVRPAAPLASLIPMDGRRRAWQELRARLGDLYLPHLRRPAWMIKRIRRISSLPFLLGLSGAALLGFLLNRPAGPAIAGTAASVCIFVGLVGMFLLGWALGRRTEDHAVCILPACATVRDMVYTLLSRPPAPVMVSTSTRACDKEIWRTICTILGNEFGVSPRRFTRDTKFTDPLRE